MGRGAVVGLLCVVLASGAVLAGAAYEITPAEPVDVPERTVQLQGSSYTINTTVRTPPNRTVTVDVTAPAEVYRVYVYNSDEQIEASKRGDGNGTVSFDLDGFAPGSYVISVYSRDSGEHEAIQPLLISGYTLSVDSPSRVETDEQFTVTVDVTSTATNGDPALVKAVLARDNETVTVEAAAEGDGYVAEVDAGNLSTGEYRVYGLAQADTQAFGRNELVGLSDPQTLVVGATPTPQPTTTADGATATATTEDRQTSRPGPSATYTTTHTGQPETQDQQRTTGAPAAPSTVGDQQRTPTQTAPAEPARSTTRDTLITPQQTAGAETAAEARGALAPGFSLLSALVAVGAGVLVGLRRRSE